MVYNNLWGKNSITERFQMIDFHVHSTCSDGSYSPTDLVDLAKKSGVSKMALTDHDNIDGLIEAQEAAKRLGVTLINGMELSVSYGKNRLVHILALGLDILAPDFIELYDAYRDGQAKQVPYVIEQLSRQGIKVETESLSRYVTGGKANRQALAKWLFAGGYAPTMARAWIDILDKIPYKVGELIGAEDAFKLIKAGGALSFLAHFHKPIGLKGYSLDEKIYHLEKLIEMGLDGLERYYPSFTESQEKELDAYIERYGLLASGGSDFHGKNRPDIKLGTGDGNLKVSNSVYDELIKRINPLKACV